MSLFETRPVNPVHHAIATLIVLGGMIWGLSQCASSLSSGSTGIAGGGAADGLKKISLKSTSYRRDGFGAVFVASFAIHNDNDYPIKDVTVTCHHAGPSGTYIDQNTRTVYEKISARGFIYVRDFNMGFVVNQAVRTACIPTRFLRE